VQQSLDRHLGGETFSIMTLRITTFSIKSLFVTLGIYDIQHKGLICDTQHI
jgi:hypothetical protein